MFSCPEGRGRGEKSVLCTPPREIGPTYRARRPADHRPNKKKKKREREMTKGGRRESFRSLLEEEIFSFFFLLEITGVVCLNGRTNLVLQTIRDRPSSSLPTLPPPPLLDQPRVNFTREAFLSSRETLVLSAKSFYLGGGRKFVTPSSHIYRR